MMNSVETQSPSGQTLTEDVYARIRNDILLGLLRPGTKLKLETMRLSYDAGVNTLREAMSRLVSEGLVANEGQRGFQVVAATLADLHDITEMRRMLECHAAELALARADLAWEARLVGAYHKLSSVEALIGQEPERYMPELEAYNREFHMVLVSGCGSRWLSHFHGIMYDQSLRYRMLAFEVHDFPREQSCNEHKEILAAALERDAVKLEKVLTQHITKGATLYSKHSLV